MRVPSAAELLTAWERGRFQGPVDRALTLWEAACPGSSRDALAALSIGKRDAGLLTIREWIFGSRIDCVVVCPSCGEALDLSFNASAIRTPQAPEGAGELGLSCSGFELTLRPLNSADAAAAAECETGQQRRRLFECCITSARRNGQPVDRRNIPDGVMDAAGKLLAEADPQASVQLDVSCTTCAHRWQPALDIVSFLWSEVEAWAFRILREVHALASAYGWSEPEILALSPARRRFYLQMVGA
jgi:hypothetical protein